MAPSSTVPTKATESDCVIHGFGVAKIKAERDPAAPLLEPVQYHPRELGLNDVEVEITHCGICASDIHTATEGWGPISTPQIVGHEIVGRVRRVGSAVTSLKAGQRVGVGPMVSSCLNANGKCRPCSLNQDPYCPYVVFTYSSKYADGTVSQGGYAEAIRVDANYVFTIPAELSDEEAAPLLCAGVTVFTPMRRYNIKPGTRVGIIGVGGLGHLAIQFASKLGADVVSISTSKSKQTDALKFGAKEHLDINDKQHVKKVQDSLDIILSTANAKNMNYDEYLSLLRFNGTFVLLASPEAPIQFQPSAIIYKQLSIVGSLIGGREDMKSMFEFAALHDVKPLVEVLPMDHCNEGVKKVNENRVRYRVVLKN